MASEDELAKTATAIDATARPTTGQMAPIVGGKVGRYVIERQLGAGGMGVVHVALDPDLERRVALKLLRTGISEDAQERLLREARAMAKLTHGNVVTVYEVSAAEGRQYIAMELVDGGSLVEWLRAAKRDEREIIEAFIAAGRGLAAAHAAGIIHRDFKPGNVLRSRTGRIAVTDFGLARDATIAGGAELVVALAPLPASGRPPGTLTEPGSLLGTPAYMAPEQWDGGDVTAATDQFAFCVALWEALAGERPFRGETFEALREAAMRGADGLDASKLPRRLRPLLLRGLARDPARRWPSMAELLARLAPSRKRVAIAGAAGGVLAIAAVVYALRSPADAAVVDACPLPAGDPVATLAGTADPLAARHVGTWIDAWQRERTDACKLDGSARAGRIDCLDRVLARTDAMVRASRLEREVAGDRPGPPLVVWRQLVAPEQCRGGIDLPASYPDAVVAALALASNPRNAAAMRARTESDRSNDCVVAYLAVVDRTGDAEKTAAARRCHDDIAVAWLAVGAFVEASRNLGDNEVVAKLRELERVIGKRDHAPLTRMLHMLEGGVAAQAGRIDDALVAFDRALAFEVGDETYLALQKIALLLSRSQPGDAERARAEIRARLPGTSAQDSWTLHWYDATAQWWQGDVAGAHARAIELAGRRPADGLRDHGGVLTGTVVDAAGKPVAGATVAVGQHVYGDAAGIATPLFDPLRTRANVEIVTTAADGTYRFASAPSDDGALLAQHGADRSIAIAVADRARLQLAPTSRVRGRVELGGRIGGFAVAARSLAPGASKFAWILAPVDAAGRFELAGVPRGDVAFAVVEARAIATAIVQKRERIEAEPRELVIELPAKRTVAVLVRTDSGTLGGGIVYVAAGQYTGQELEDLTAATAIRQIAQQQLSRVVDRPPPEAAALYKPGDVVAMIQNAPIGPAIICAQAFSTKIAQGELHAPRCQALPENAAVVVVEVERVGR